MKTKMKINKKEFYNGLLYRVFMKSLNCLREFMYKSTN